MLIASISQAQPIQKTLILLNGVAHIGNGEIVENSAIAIDGDRILFVADARTIRIDSSKADVIHLQGQHVYPGLIAANSIIGLSEIKQVRATHDFQEPGDLNPNARSLIAFNNDSEILKTVRSNGILMAQPVPRGSLLAGTSSLVFLDGENWENSVIKSGIGLHLYWPTLKLKKKNPDLKPVNAEQKLQVLDRFFASARAYFETEEPEPVSLKYEAMKLLFEQDRKLFVHANLASDILAAIEFCNRHSVKMVLVGGHDAYLLIDILKNNEIPVILETTLRLPFREDTEIDLPYRLPALLQEAGVVFCISHKNSWDQRNLPFVAGITVAYGLTKEQALASITGNAAEILGVGELTGTIEQGKFANLVVSKGDILDMATNDITMALINGKPLDLDNHHKELFRKYVDRYQIGTTD